LIKPLALILHINIFRILKMFRFVIIAVFLAVALGFNNYATRRVTRSSNLKMALFDAAKDIVGSDIEYPGMLLCIE